MGSGASKGKEPPGCSYPCCWSDLPLDLAGIVLLRLHAHADHLRFGSVCRHWRYAWKLHSPSSPPPLPWLNFRDGTFKRLTDSKRHRVRLQIYERCRGSFDNWLLLEDVGAWRGKHYLKNPLSGDVVCLPDHCKEPVRRGWDDARVVPPSSTTFHIQKVVMCVDGLIAAMISYHELPNVVVFCWPGMSSWPKGICNGTRYHDIARYKGKMYAVSRRGDLYEHELRRDAGTGDPVVTRVERVILAPLSAEGFPPEAVTTLDGPYAAALCARSQEMLSRRVTGQVAHGSMDHSPQPPGLGRRHGVQSVRGRSGDLPVGTTGELERSGSLRQRQLLQGHHCRRPLQRRPDIFRRLRP